MAYGMEVSLSTNFNNSVPAAPPGYTNVTWQTDGNGNDSACVPTPILTDLNTLITSLIPGDVLVWNGSDWVNATPPSAELEVNGTPNTVQSLLNLIAGSNITLTDNGMGGVTIASTGGGSGSLILLETHAASSSAQLDFTSLSSAYDEYMIEVVGLNGSANGFAFLVQLSTDGGSTFDSTDANYIGGSHYTQMDGGASGDNHANGSVPGAYLSDSYNAGQPGVSASIKFFNDASAANWRQFTYQTNGPGSGGGYFTQTGGAIWKNSAQANAMRFILSTGNMASGVIRLYGITP